MEDPVNFLPGKEEQGADVAHQADGPDDEDEEPLGDVAERVVGEFPAHAVDSPVAADARAGKKHRSMLLSSVLNRFVVLLFDHTLR